jgi:hypothetical protein
MKDMRQLLEQRKDFLQVSITTKSMGEIDINLFEELLFDSENIKDHVECQSAMMAFYNVVERKAEEELDIEEMTYDVWFTKVYEIEFQRLWRQVNMAKTGKPSKDSVEKAVKVRHGEEYIKRQRELIQSRNRVAILKDSSRWLDEKGRMLVQASKFALSEYGSVGFEKMGSGVTKSNDRVRQQRKGENNEN